MTILRRGPILKACRGGPVSGRELETETDSSRTTVYRATVELEEQGLLEQQNGGYRTTARGAATSRVAEEYLRGIETVDRLEPLLDRFPHPEVLVNLHRLSDAELTVDDDAHIYRANDRVFELWADTDRVRMGAVSPGSRFYRREEIRTTIENDVDVETCFLPDAVPTAEQMESDAFDPSDVFDHYETHISEAVPFTFILYDDVATIAAHNEVRIPVVLAESADARVYQWLQGIYTDRKASARQIRRIPV